MICYVMQGDLDDPRFGALLTRAEFAFDPTDPHFRRPGVPELASEVARRKKSGKAAPNVQGQGSAGDAKVKPAPAGKSWCPSENPEVLCHVDNQRSVLAWKISCQR